jgi:hypothetical protein
MYALCGLVDMRGAPAPEIKIFRFGDTTAGSEFFLIGEVETSVDIDLSFVVTGESGSPVILLFMLLLKEFRAEMDLES